jgi:hypothetical protein
MSDLEYMPHLRAKNNTFFDAKTLIPATNRPIYPILEQSTNQSPTEVSNRPILQPDCSLVDCWPPCNEYMALPRDLELEHSSLPLRVGNHARKSLLRDMATVEAEGTVLGGERGLCEERRKAVYRDVEADLWTIRMVVGSARILGGGEGR